MKIRWSKRPAVTVALLMVMTVLSGCGWQGINSLPLPGTHGNGPGSFVVQAQLKDVNNLKQNARVRVGDVDIGHVSKIDLQGWHALVTMRLDSRADLPANATVKIGQTTVLGSQHIELAPPTDVPPEGRLREGSLIPLSRSGAFPTPEQALAAVSLVLNGGGVGQVGDIVHALSTAFHGRENDLRSLVGQLDLFATNLGGQTSDIIAASESLNELAGKFAAKQPVLDQALQTIPNALAVLNDERGNLAQVADQLGKFSAMTTDTINKTKGSLVKELKDIAPVLESVANAGPSLNRALHYIFTPPFPTDTIEKWQRGDYANLTAIIDLTLSRIDAGFFTGTKWECDLTELELQWGRTIGQYPSPCLAGGHFNLGNPLAIPYHADQGN